MSKTLRTVALIAGSVALIATGVGAAVGAKGLVVAGTTITASTLATVGTVAGLVSTAATIGAQITAPKPTARGSTTRVIIDAEPPRPYMIGESYSAGILRHRVGYGATLKKVPNPFLWEVKVFSGVGPVEALVEEQFDFGSVGGYYSGFYSSTSQLGARPESGALTPPFGAAPGWSSAHKLSGCAAIGGNYKFDKDGKVFASGVPLHGAVWRGEKVYDPRLDSTYPGGSGSCRLGVESTYVYSASPPLHAGTYAYGRYQNGVRIFGLGLSGDAIDWAAIVDWANDCDTVDWTIHGTIYEGGRGADVRQQRVQNLDDICAAGGGRWLQAGALLSFDWHRPRVPLATLTDDDLLEEGGSATAVQTIRERMNGIRPQYVSAAHNWEQITADEIIGSTYRTEDDQPLTQTWALNLVKDPAQAGELACYALVDSREIGPIELKCKAAWRFYKPGETITINSSLLGYQGQAVIIARDLDPQTLAVKLVVKSETPAKHDFALGKVADPPPSPILTQTQEDRDLVKYGAITPRAVDVVFADDQNVEELQPAEPGATEGAVVPVPGSGQPGNIKDGDGNYRDPGELLNSEIELTAAGRLQYRPLPDVEPVQLGQIRLPDLNAVSQDAFRRAEDDIDQVATALAVALDEASRTRATFTDAGFYVDPATGQVRIHAIEQTKERVSTAEIRLNAAESSILLRATNSYVNEQIALAVIDPSQIAELEDIFLRIGAAEVDIDGLNATVTTLATVTELSLVQGRVTTAEEAIDALEGTITTKVDTTTFDALATRVTTAETTLTAIGDTASIVNSVSAVRLVEKAQDANAEQDLRALLLGDRTKREQVAAIAAARQELTARIIDGDTAEAAFRLALQVRVGAAEASLATESITRASADSALASQITTLSASTTTSLGALTAALNAEVDAREGDVATLTASITSEQSARTDADSALASDISDLSASLTTAAGTLQTNINDANQARIDGDAALASSITTLNAELDTEVSNRAAAVSDEAQARIDGDGLIAAGLAQQVTAGRVLQGEASELADLLLGSLLNNDRNRREVNGAVAGARQEITAQIVSEVEALSTRILALVARVAGNEASIIEESIARVTAVESLASTITTLNASFTGALSAEATARTSAIAAEATTRATAITNEATARATAIDEEAATRATLISGLESDIGSAIIQIGDEEAARIEGDETIAAAVEAETAAREAVVTTLTASISSEASARASADGALAGQITTLNTTVGAQSATLNTFGESIDGLKARWGAKVDVNGRVGGFVLNGTSDDIDAIFVVDNFKVVDPDTGTAFLDADADGLRLQNGKIIMNNGTNMLVMGAGFGVDSQFVMWFGPSQPIEGCNEADALFFLDVTGDGEYGLRLGSNFYKNSGTGTSLASNAQIIVGPFVTDGGSKQVSIGYTYFRNVLITDAFVYTGAVQAVLRVERSVNGGTWATVGDYTFNGTATGFDGFGPSEPGSATIQINQAASFTDTTSGTGTFSYRATIISRSVDGLTSTVSLEDALNQTVTLISTEQIT